MNLIDVVISIYSTIFFVFVNSTWIRYTDDHSHYLFSVEYPKILILISNFSHLRNLFFSWWAKSFWIKSNIFISFVSSRTFYSNSCIFSQYISFDFYCFPNVSDSNNILFVSFVFRYSLDLILIVILSCQSVFVISDDFSLFYFRVP